MGIRIVAFLESCDTPVFWSHESGGQTPSILARPAHPCAIRWVGIAPIPLPSLFLVEGEVAMNLRAPRSDGPSPPLSISPHDEFMRTAIIRKLTELKSQLERIRTMQHLLRRMTQCCHCDTLDECGKGIFRKACSNVAVKPLAKVLSRRASSTVSTASQKSPSTRTVAAREH